MTAAMTVYGIGQVRPFFDVTPAMPKSLKITLDVLLIVIPLVIVIYFLSNPDAFNAFLDWMMRTL
jgi:hypothetical protein